MNSQSTLDNSFLPSSIYQDLLELVELRAHADKYPEEENGVMIRDTKAQLDRMIALKRSLK